MPQMQAQDIDYRQSTRRLFILTAALGGTGSLLALAFWGRPAGGGFAIGSAASLLNLWLWHRITAWLSAKDERRSRFVGALFACRLLALFALGYVILNALNVEPLAAILGLLTSAMAVVAEITIELAFVAWRRSGL
jgi:hypothetical protein